MFTLGLLVLGGASLSGCASRELTASRALEPLACVEAGEPGELREIMQRPELSGATLSPCGQLAVMDHEGAVWLGGGDLRMEPFDGTAYGVQRSRRGEQAILSRSAGFTWLDELGVARSYDYQGASFLRFRDDSERPLYRHESLFGVIDADGATRIVASGLDRYSSWAVAAEAPVIAVVARSQLGVSVIDVETGELAYIDVPYEGQRLELSRDGRVLFMGAAGSEQARFYAIDGDEVTLLAELRVSGGLVHAPRAGHVISVRTSRGFAVVTHDLYVNVFEPAIQLELEPNGDRALVQLTPGEGEEGWPIVLAHLDRAELSDVATTTAQITPWLPSPSGDLLAAWGRVPLGAAFGATWRWSSEELSTHEGEGFERAPIFVTDAGARVIDEGGALLFVDPEGGLTRVEEVGNLRAVRPAGGGDSTLVWYFAAAGTEHVAVVDATGALEPLFDGGGPAGSRIQDLSVDRRGRRVAWLERDPSGAPRVMAGALP